MSAAQPAFSDGHVLTPETKPLCLRRGRLVSAGLSPCLNWGVLLPGRLELNLAGVEKEGEIPFMPGLAAPCTVSVEHGSVPQEVPFGQTQDQVRNCIVLMEQTAQTSRAGHACHPVSPGSA